MFSADNRYETRRDLFENRFRLTPKEEKELERIEQVLRSGTEDQRYQLTVDLIINIKAVDRFFKFYFNSVPFKQYCSQDEFSHMDHFAEILEILEHPNIPLRALDGGDGVSVLDHYFGVYFLGEYQKFLKGEEKVEGAQGQFNLDLACDFGFYEALTTRCEKNINIIRNENTRDRELTDALAQLLTDGKRIGNLYWAPGYLHMAIEYLKLGDFFGRHGNKLADQAHKQVCHERALEYFLRVKYLMHYEPLGVNEKLIKIMLGEEGLGLVKFIKPNGEAQFFLKDHLWDQAEEMFLCRVDRTCDRTRPAYRALSDRLEREVQNQIQQIEQHEFDL